MSLFQSRPTHFAVLLPLTALLAGCGGAPARKDASAQAGSKKAELPLDQPRLFVRYKPVESLPRDPKVVSRRGLEVLWVYEWGATRKAGLQPGDVILAVNGEPLDRQPLDRIDPTFLEVVHHTQPGQALHLTVLRWKDHRSLSEEGRENTGEPPAPEKTLSDLIASSKPGHRYSVSWRRDFEVLELAPVPGDSVAGRGDVAALPDQAIESEWKLPKRPVLEKIWANLGEIYGINPQLRTQRDWLTLLGQTSDAFRVQLVSYLLRHPFATGAAAQAVLSPIEQADPNSAYALARGTLASATKLMSPGSSPLPASDAPEVRQYLDGLQKLLGRAQSLRDEAFAGLTPEERAFLEGQADEAVAALGDSDTGYKSDTEAARKNLRVLALAGKVRIAPLAQAASLLLELTRRDFLHGLKAALSREGLDLRKEELAKRSTPSGDIVIAGSASHRYRDLSGVGILIKFGGHNIFSNGAGASSSAHRIQAVITLDAENELYSNVRTSQGAGLLGVGILASLGHGHSFYMAEDAAQGFGFLGVGLLLDEGERTEFRASTLAQGAGFAGIGALIATGHGQLFDAHQLAQGVGIAGGVGALVNPGGRSEYLLKGRFASSYDNPGAYTGFGQGTGYGVRDVASGGVGILYDGHGGSTFNAGEFAQGGGYYYGWGILKAAGNGSNVFKGTHYAQGYSAHYAIGTFFGGEGDDRYECLTRACTGISHDLGVTWFEEAGGKNRYQCAFFTNGSSTHNSLSVWIDRSNRGYCEGPHKPANPQGNQYHGGTSLSLVFGINGNPAFPGVPDGKPMLARDDYFFLFNPSSRQSVEDFADLRLLKSIAPPLTKSPEVDYRAD